MERLSELERLAGLRASGTLTDEEFQTEKARLLKAPSPMFNRALIVAIVALVAVIAALLIMQRRATPDAKPVPPTTAPSAVQTPVVPQTAPTSEAQPAANKLQQLFRRDILGAQISYFEGMTGPARNVAGSSRTYLVDGCEVVVVVEAKAVQSIGLAHISPKCNVSLKDFGFDGPMTDKITFGMLERLGFDTKYGADCLGLCGNAFDPYVHAVVQTPHSNDFLMFRPSANIEVEPMLTAAMKWEDMMKKAKGEDWITDARFNCDRAFDDAASNLFRNIKIDSIEVGTFPDPKC